MKPEKEFKWLGVIYHSSYCRHFSKNFNLFYEPGCIRDFEILLKCSENEKQFRSWFKELLSLGVFSYSKEIRKGYRKNVLLKGYIANGSKLIKYAKDNALWKPTSNMVLNSI